MNDTRPGAIIGDRFVIEALAGSGGMGQVYRALDTRTRQRVALKILHAGMPALAERFAREARLLAQLEHPNIVRYIAHGDGAPFYLAMEWLEGEDLGRRLSRGALGIRETISIARCIAEALDVAHQRGVVHRDLKPGNIFLGVDAESSVKLLDFGVARPITGTRAMTRTGQMLGTIGYMAPEQAREGCELRAAVDVFSLGCVVFECLAGQPAYAGSGLMAVLSKMLFSDPPRVSDLREDVPIALDELVLRMMKPRPEHRPTTPALIAELDALARGPLGHLEPRARRLRPKSGAQTISGAEQRLMAIVLAKDGSGGIAPDLTLPSHGAASSEQLAHTVASYSGRVETLPNGTLVVVLESAGVATDLARRAARCALALRHALSETSISVAIGRGDPSEPCPPDTVLMCAQKLLDPPTAKHGLKAASIVGIRIDPTTACLLDGEFELAGHGETLELVGQRGDVDPARRLLGTPTPFVGRARELAMLEAAFDECIAERVASAVVVTGPAGVGKSRLWHELARSVAGREGVVIWSARGDAIAPRTAFGMLGQLVLDAAGIETNAPSELRMSRLAARVGRHLPAHDAEQIAGLLGKVVHAALDGGPSVVDAPDDRVLGAWETFVAAECSKAAVLIVLDDLHWGDLPSMRFIDATLRALRACPLMVLALARPELNAVFPQLWSERRVQSLRLAELTPRAARELACAVLEERDLDLDRLIERASGNPFDLEELLRGAAAGDSAPLPEPVLALALARLEQLAPDARRLLRAASVFGSTFWLGGAAAVTGSGGPHLGELIHRELVTRCPSSRYKDEEQLAFRNPVIREAAYAMLTDRDRQLGHRLAGAWLDAAGERDASVIAEHLELGGEPGGAVVWYLWAAEQALQANEFATVIAHAERGIACGATEAMRGELLLLEAEAAGWMARTRDQAQLATEALALLPRGSSASVRAGAELVMASCRLGDHDQLRLTLAQIQPIGVGTSLPGAAHAIALARTINALLISGERSAAEAIARLLDGATSNDRDDDALLATTRDWIGSALALAAGQPEQAATTGTAVAAAFATAGYLRCAIEIELQISVALAALGDDARAIEQARQTIERATRAGLVPIVICARTEMALPLARCGQLDEAEEIASSCIEAAIAAPDRVLEGRARASLAAIQLLAGESDDHS
jgi:eukaryotic-like serine/threonine-protein kinase